MSLSWHLGKKSRRNWKTGPGKPAARREGAGLAPAFPNYASLPERPPRPSG
jgi:hypothetical protein